MAVITITILESNTSIVSGIPDSIVIETSIPSTVFYTIDGSTPTTSSDVFIDTISLPTDQGTVELKIFATDGSNTSAIISQTFGPNLVGARNARDTVSGIQLISGGFPFSSYGSGPVNGVYGNAGGVIVNDPTKTQIPDGYNGTGTNTPADYTNENVYSYQLLFSETNSIGESGRGIGTLPASVVGIRDTSNQFPESSNTASPFFDAKALVIYHDGREVQFSDAPRVNRPFFSLENDAKARDGALKSTNEPLSVTGSAMRPYFNPVNNTLEFSYFDSRSNRWIFSTVPYTPKENQGNLGAVVFPSSNNPGSRFVFKWIPFRYRKLI